MNNDIEGFNLSLFKSIEHRGHNSYFISFEGIDGSGKSTQIKLFKEKLEKDGFNVHLFREPGATPIGEKLREVILKSDETMDPLSEAMIFLTSRLENLKRNILPLIKEDKTIVLMDRFIDSTITYQCYGGGLNLSSLLQIHTQGLLKYLPDLTFYLDIDMKTSLERRAQRAEETDYFEKQQDKFMENVLLGYRSLIDLFPNRIKKVQAKSDPKTVHQTIMQIWESHA